MKKKRYFIGCDFGNKPKMWTNEKAYNVLEDMVNMLKQEPKNTEYLKLDGEIYKLTKFPNGHWLLTGEGEPVIEMPITITPAEVIALKSLQ